MLLTGAHVNCASPAMRHACCIERKRMQGFVAFQIIFTAFILQLRHNKAVTGYILWQQPTCKITTTKGSQSDADGTEFKLPADPSMFLCLNLVTDLKLFLMLDIMCTTVDERRYTAVWLCCDQNLTSCLEPTIQDAFS
jgi:hypothetical protein